MRQQRAEAMTTLMHLLETGHQVQLQQVSGPMYSVGVLSPRMVDTPGPLVWYDAGTLPDAVAQIPPLD